MADPYRKPAKRPPPPAVALRWYTKSGDVEKGPFEVDAIKRSLKEGLIRNTTLVRREDQREWHAITDIGRFGGAATKSSLPVSPAPPPPAGLDDGTKVLIYGALACALTYIGLIFGIMGLRLAREQRRKGATKYTRVGRILSVVGIGIQLVLIGFAVIVIVLTRRGVIQ